MILGRENEMGMVGKELEGVETDGRVEIERPAEDALDELVEGGRRTEE
jgi:hypothetical protein